jgi:hypothetical protein
MSANIPELKIRITPRSSSSTIDTTEVTVIIPPLPSNQDSALACLPSCPLLILRAADVDAADGHGKLSLSTGNTDGMLRVVGRKTEGPLKLHYYVHPIEENRTEILEHSFDFHRGREGFLCSGMSFIPTLSAANLYHIIVEWDLSQVPKGTRAIWTYGEVAGTIDNIDTASLLTDSVYMVGSISSIPPTPISGTASDYYGYYWFGDLPPILAAMKSIHYDFFLKASEWFSFPLSAARPFRTFIHTTGNAPSFTGTSFLNSHIFSYSNQIDHAHDYDLIRRMTYSIVSHFLLPPPTPSTITSNFAFEGIKHCLSIYFPFRFKFRTGDYFRATINMLCTKYYTHPLVHLPQSELLKLAQIDEHAKAALESRAWAFVLAIDLRARRMSDLTRPVEEIAIKPFAKSVAEGKSYGIETFIDLMKPLMGDEVEKMYEEMLLGKLIRFPVSLFGAKTHYMKRVDQEVLDFGFETGSFEKGRINRLKVGSRAMKAGLREGDTILSTSEIWRFFDHIDAEIEIVVLRDGEEERIRYWPRSVEKVESWQLVEISEDEEEKNAYWKIRSEEWGERA